VSLVRLTLAPIDAVERVATYSGSGFKAGLFSEHVFRTSGSWGLTLGTSGGALAALASSMGCLEEFRELSLGYSDQASWNGVKGYSSLAILGGSLWSLKPLRRKLEGLVEKYPLRHPVGVGVVCIETGRHHVLLMGADTPHATIVDAVLASAAIAVVFPAIKATWLNDVPQHFADGGHQHYIPVLTRKDIPALRQVHAVFARPLRPLPKDHKPGILNAARWLLDQATVATMRRDMARLRSLPAAVSVFAPAPDVAIGHTLQADADTQQVRALESMHMWQRGPVVL
jgi:predicted acylesterase/phospholipase RssA